MADNLEFLLSLKADIGNAVTKIESVTGQLEKVTNAATAASNATRKVTEGGGGMGLGLLNLDAAMNLYHRVSGKISECTGAAMELINAQTQLKNTMINTGTYSKEAFDKAIAGAEALSKGVKAQPEHIMAMQAQMRMVGGVSEEMIKNMSKSALDYSAKMGISLQEAGSQLSKAVNDPDSLARLKKALLLDPAAVERIEKLSKAGKTAQAQMALLGLVNAQVGGAAKSAFDADPVAQ
jgi:hypothetical protein